MKNEKDERGRGEGDRENSRKSRMRGINNGMRDTGLRNRCHNTNRKWKAVTRGGGKRTRQREEVGQMGKTVKMSFRPVRRERRGVR